MSRSARSPRRAYLSRRYILCRLLRAIEPLDAEQLQVLELVTIAIRRGAR